MTPDTALATDLSRQALDSLPVNIAVLDADGTIVWTDTAWRNFARDNDIVGPPDTVGTNYIAVSEDTDELGDEAADGLRAVLGGERERDAERRERIHVERLLLEGAKCLDTDRTQ